MLISSIARLHKENKKGEIKLLPKKKKLLNIDLEFCHRMKEENRKHWN